MPKRGEFRVDAGKGRGFKIVGTGHAIENSLYWEGLLGHEAETMRTWIALAEHSRTVLDVGANSGVFSLAAYAVGAKCVHAFEPLDRVFRVLRTNADLNSPERIRCWQFAVSDREGEADLFDPGGDVPASASISQEFISDRLRLPTTRIKVRTVSIDQFCEANSLQDVDLIKVDVEGHEASVLKGMRGTVLRMRPHVILEVLPGYEQSLRELVDSEYERSYEWLPIAEQAGTDSRNVLLRPIGARRRTGAEADGSRRSARTA